MSTNKIKPGNDSKDSMYLSRIKTAIALNREHPRHKGVKMQAHHVISAKGVDVSKLGPKLVNYGYDINSLNNLVFIPCTLQGACHLGIQPHRGNHTARIPDQDSYDDDTEPVGYHAMVSRFLKSLKLPMAEECEDEQESHKVKKALNNLSEQIAYMIQNAPSQAPLTQIARFFDPGNPIGCGGLDSVTLHKGTSSCAVERNHLARQGPNQKAENISYPKSSPYTLRVGE